MVKKKEIYRSPESEFLAIAFAELLCQSRSSEELEDPVPWSGSNGWN